MTHDDMIRGMRETLLNAGFVLAEEGDAGPEGVRGYYRHPQHRVEVNLWYGSGNMYAYHDNGRCYRRTGADGLRTLLGRMLPRKGVPVGGT